MLSSQPLFILIDCRSRTSLLADSLVDTRGVFKFSRMISWSSIERFKYKREDKNKKGQSQGIARTRREDNRSGVNWPLSQILFGSKL